MSWLKNVFREILGLFVDDGSFAIAILVWLALFWWLLPHLPVASAWPAVIFFAGLIAILIESAIRRSRQR